MNNKIFRLLNNLGNYNKDKFNLKNTLLSNNRLNSVGEGLEKFIYDAFLFNGNEEDVFSYKGNKNNPPDFILKNAEALEIKKISSPFTSLALNSSYPKDYLFNDSSMITKGARDCEPNWLKKEMVYIISYVEKNNIKYIFIVYGSLFCADSFTYTKIKDLISNTIEATNIDLSPTNEIAKIKKVDPLGITDLRVRGMWHIENPIKVFDYIYKYNQTDLTEIIALIPFRKEMLLIDNYSVKEVKVKDPNNPINKLDAILLNRSV